MALSGPILQEDFSAGMVRVAPHLIPRNGAYRLENFLLDEDGSAYRRSGTSYVSNAPFGISGLRMVWDGWLAGGQRTVIADADSFGVLASDGETVVDIGGPGLPGPVRPVVIDDLLFVADSVYGGSRKTLPYLAGTIALTEGSASVTGTGTAWAANVDAGMVLVIGDRVYAVAAVIDNTHLELARAFTGSSTSGASYTLEPVAAVPQAYNPGGMWAVAGQRLVSLKGDRAAMSAQFDSSSWTEDDEWLLPEGVQLLGGGTIGDTVMTFTTSGVWTIGNLDYDLTDDAGNTQQTLRQVNSDLVLWGAAGIATWENQLVVPAVDGVWLLGLGSAKLLSQSIAPLYADYVAAGYQPGQATVHRGHYLLPILDSGGQPVDLLVCRLDRPIEVQRLGQVWPWTNWAGAGAKVSALTVRVSAGATRSPVLLGADRSPGSRVISYGAFKPDGFAADHNGTVPTATFVSRDFAAGGLDEFVKKLRVRYELVSATVATLKASYGTEARGSGTLWGTALWGAFVWADSEGLGLVALAPDGPVSNGGKPWTWKIGRRVRYVRIQLRCTDPCERLVLRSLALSVRPSGRI